GDAAAAGEAAGERQRPQPRGPQPEASSSGTTAWTSATDSDEEGGSARHAPRRDSARSLPRSTGVAAPQHPPTHVPAPSHVQRQFEGAVDEHGVPKALPVQSATHVAAASAGVGATIEVTRGSRRAAPSPALFTSSRRVSGFLPA